MKAVIISFNCVIDTHFYVDKLVLGEENSVTKKESFAAGKGTNVAKALNQFDVPYTLFALVGNKNFQIYKSLLKKEGLNSIIFDCEGTTRENFSIHGKNISETRLCSNGFRATDRDCELLIQKASEVLSEGDIVVVSGRLPNGIKKDRIVQKLNELKSKKIRFVIDSASFSFEDYKVFSPLLVKPNETEIKAYGKSVEEAVCRLLKCGIEYIAYSKGENGIELYDRNNKFIAKPPQIIPLSTVGAGDSAVAGFIYGLMKNLDIKETLKYAVSFGTANCMSAGGNPPSKFDVKELFEKIIIL